MNESRQPVLGIRGLRKAFGALEVLRGIDLDAYEGDVISILGASGSGKSTLLRCINLLEVPEAGELVIAGESVRLTQKSDGSRVPADRAQLDRLRSRLGFVFQSFNLWSHMTVLQNVIEAPVHVQKRPRAEAIAEAEALLEKVGIADKRDHYPAHLSGGQQQRAAIARALVQGADVIIADEPIASLDPSSARRVMDILADLNQTEKITVLVSLHQVEYAIGYCPRTIALRAGRVVYDGPSKALTPHFLAELYGAESEELFLPGLEAEKGRLHDGPAIPVPIGVEPTIAFAPAAV